jgi:hypothetical protein
MNSYYANPDEYPDASRWRRVRACTTISRPLNVSSLGGTRGPLDTDLTDTNIIFVSKDFPKALHRGG